MRELLISSRLHHPNVLGLLGYSSLQDDLPAIITKWMDNGTALEYLKNQHPEVDTLSMVSLREVNTILL